MNVRDHGIALRSRAIGMLEGSIAKKDVAHELNVSLRSVKRWWGAHKKAQSLETKSRSGRTQILNRANKIVISKSLGKQRKSTRKIAQKLKNKGTPVSHMTIYRHLKDTIGATAFKRQKIPHLSLKNIRDRLDFARKYQQWTVNDWKQVLWSDESPFELFSTPNRHNDRVWAKSTMDVPPLISVKFPTKIHVWGLMSHQALSQLHIIPQGQSINSSYYRNDILEKTCKDAINRTSISTSILERPMLEKMSNFIFMQDGAPAHTAKATQQWCQENLQSFWKKADWPGNSPDLNPIENLWAIVKERVNEKGQINNRKELIQTLKLAWETISPEILENLVSSMPQRIRLLLEREGQYINK